MASWLGAETDGETPFDRTFGLIDNTYTHYRDFYARVWGDPNVPATVKELCRLRIAKLLGCEYELALRYREALDEGLTEEKISELPNYYRSSVFDEAERASVAFAEKFVIDPHGITDDEAKAVTDRLGDDGLRALVVALALFDGFSRFRVFLGIEPDWPGTQIVDAPTEGALSIH